VIAIVSLLLAVTTPQMPAQPQEATAHPEQPLTPKIAIVDQLVIKVGDKEKAADELAAAADAAGGYFTTRNDTFISLRVPHERQGELLAKAATLGLIVRRSHNAEDLTAYLEQQRSVLASRRDVLERYFEVLHTARPQAVTTVEHQMTTLIAQIEQLQGSLVFAEHRLAYSQLDVSFEFRDRQAPANDGSSSFPWLNTMNLVDLIGDFQHGAR
jgi:hypothetical protein